MDEKTKILIVVRRLKNAKLRQQIRSVVYNQEYYLQIVINKQKYPNRTNPPDKQGEYAKLLFSVYIPKRQCRDYVPDAGKCTGNAANTRYDAFAICPNAEADLYAGGILLLV